MKMKNNTKEKMSEVKAMPENDMRDDNSVEIPMYAPNMSITAGRYKISEKLTGLEANFEEICLQFLSKASPDKFNSDYFDSMIDRVCSDALAYIDGQRISHERTLRDIEIMHIGDLKVAEKRLEQIRILTENKKKELEKNRRIYEIGSGSIETVVGGE